MIKFASLKRIGLLSAALAVVVPTLSGCYGSFALTRKVYKINGSLGNKWINSLFTFVLGVPVYGFTSFVDAVGLNLIEFWTGSNPVASKSNATFNEQLADGTKVQAKHMADGRLEVTLEKVGEPAKTIVLAQEVDGIRATAPSGELIAKVASAADGRVVMITPKAQ